MPPTLSWRYKKQGAKETIDGVLEFFFFIRLPNFAEVSFSNTNLVCLGNSEPKIYQKARTTNKEQLPRAGLAPIGVLALLVSFTF